VEDFARWQQAFDDDAAARAAAGEESWQIFQDENDPNQVTIVTKFQSSDHAHKHLQSENFRETIRKAGVVGEPDIHFVNEA
jgi:quinol monooxygenase YgiN